MYNATTRRAQGMLSKSSVKHRSCSSPAWECPTERNISSLRCTLPTGNRSLFRINEQNSIVASVRAYPMLLDSSFRFAKLSKPCACATRGNETTGCHWPRTYVFTEVKGNFIVSLFAAKNASFLPCTLRQRPIKLATTESWLNRVVERSAEFLSSQKLQNIVSFRVPSQSRHLSEQTSSEISSKVARILCWNECV